VWDSPFPCIGVFLQGGFASLSAERLRALFADVPADSDPIQLWELYAVVVAVRLFPACLAGGSWCVLVDNGNVHTWLTKGTVKGDVCFPQALAMLKDIFTTSVALRFRLSSRHVPGEENGLADALSREQWPRFAGLLRDWALGAHPASHPPALTWLAHPPSP
jgi:hypothetical protein